ncbi:MAG TPA: TldD/PmbA family protein [Gemmatimonadales bacterium]|nr:TldD/PmbA family protein [Gemmatimonadales bacterium]
MKDRLAAAVKQSRADYTEIRVERAWSSTVAFRGRRLETATVSEDQGGFVRVLNKGCGWGIASFTSLDALPDMVRRANELSRAVRLDEPIRLAETTPQLADAALDLDGDVRGVALADKKKLLETYNTAMLAVSNAIVDTQASYQDEVSEVWYVNSEGTALYQVRPEVVVSGTAIARRNGTIEKGLESIGLRKGWRSVQEFGERFRDTAQRAVHLLDAPRVRGGSYPVILDNELAGVFIHEAFGHLSEADFVYENPQAREMMTLGRRFGKPVLNAGDNGAASGLRGTLPYDDEGTPTQDTPLIREGILVGRLHSRETAAKLGERPTGNARAISFRHPPIVRMTNTYISAPTGEAAVGFQDLIRDIKLGVYACGAFGGQTMLENFSFTAAWGHMIRDGHVAELVKDVVLAGNLFQTLDRIDQMAGDFTWNEMGGGCGKGGQFPLPVTEGAPHVRIEEALIGGDV